MLQWLLTVADGLAVFLLDLVAAESILNSGTDGFSPPLDPQEDDMNGPDILARHRRRLARLLVERRSPPPAKPLAIRPCLATAMLQKAIRRGEEVFALEAAATLLKTSPDRFWRRCGVIAAE